MIRRIALILTVIGLPVMSIASNPFILLIGATMVLCATLLLMAKVNGSVIFLKYAQHVSKQSLNGFFRPFQIGDEWFLYQNFKIYYVHGMNIRPTIVWFHAKNGRIHRENGPAIYELTNKVKETIYQLKPKRSITTNVINKSHRGIRHAVDFYSLNGACAFITYRKIYQKRWIINGQNYTNDIANWIIENDLPNYKKWDDNIWIMFKLKFA